MKPDRQQMQWQVLKLHPDAYCKGTGRGRGAWFMVRCGADDRIIGTGNTAVNAWRDALKNLVAPEPEYMI